MVIDGDIVENSDGHSDSSSNSVVINTSCIMVNIYPVIAFIIRNNTKNYVIIVLSNGKYEKSVVDIGYDFMNVLHTNL